MNDLIEDAIIVDEIGVASGAFGAFRLKSVFQPIFAAAGDELAPWGAEAKLRPLRDNEAVASEVVAQSLSPGELHVFEQLCRTLHLRNYPVVGVDNLSLFLGIDTQAARDTARMVEALELLATETAAIDVPPHLIVCSLANNENADKAVLLRVATAIRLHGFSLGSDDFTAGFPGLEQVTTIRPDVVRIEGAWFRRVMEVPRASRLLRPLFAGFTDAGAAVLVDGIETAAQLDAALEAGAALVQGPLLAKPALAGSIFPIDAVPRSAFTAPASNVVRLADRRPSHQRR
jgi:EAL domain-containing protein (putative c-di-GMP-specific phosphodiesterase class I)